MPDPSSAVAKAVTVLTSHTPPTSSSRRKILVTRSAPEPSQPSNVALNGSISMMLGHCLMRPTAPSRTVEPDTCPARAAAQSGQVGTDRCAGCRHGRCAADTIRAEDARPDRPAFNPRQLFRRRSRAGVAIPADRHGVAPGDAALRSAGGGEAVHPDRRRRRRRSNARPDQGTTAA